MGEAFYEALFFGDLGTGEAITAGAENLDEGRRRMAELVTQEVDGDDGCRRLQNGTLDVLTAEIAPETDDVVGELGLLYLDDHLRNAAVGVPHRGAVIHAIDREPAVVMVDFNRRLLRGRHQLQYLAVDGFTDDIPSDTVVVHEVLENDIVDGIGYGGHGMLPGSVGLVGFAFSSTRINQIQINSIQRQRHQKILTSSTTTFRPFSNIGIFNLSNPPGIPLPL